MPLTENQLRQKIDDWIYTNNAKSITAPKMNELLNDLIDFSKGFNIGLAIDAGTGTIGVNGSNVPFISAEPLVKKWETLTKLEEQGAGLARQLKYTDEKGVVKLIAIPFIEQDNDKQDLIWNAVTGILKISNSASQADIKTFVLSQIPAQTPISKNDTATIAITANGTLNHTLAANVKISADAGNAITAKADGIYSTAFALALANTDTIKMNYPGNVLSGDIIFGSRIVNVLGQQNVSVVAYGGLYTPKTHLFADVDGLRLGTYLKESVYTHIPSADLFNIISGNVALYIDSIKNVPNGILGLDANGQFDLDKIAQSGAVENQGIVFNGINWVPGNILTNVVASGEFTGTGVDGDPLTIAKKDAAQNWVLAWDDDESLFIPKDLSGNYWSLLGNAGTVDGTNFIGTTDDKPFNIRVNNQKSGRIHRVERTAFFGYQAGLGATGSDNVGIGSRTLVSAVLPGGQNTAVGSGAMEHITTGEANTAIGYGSMGGATTGKYNTAVGAYGGGDVFGGLRNTMLGYGAGFNLETGNDNILIGANVSVNTLSGSKNIFVGVNAGAINVSGSSNIVIGYAADLSANNLTNAIAIGANAYVGASNSLVLGSINGVNSAVADTKVAIGISVPTEKLHLVGNLRLQGAFMPNNLAGTAGQVLSSAGANTSPVWIDQSGLAAALTSTYIGYGSGTNVLTGSADFRYELTNKKFVVGFAAKNNFVIDRSIDNGGTIYIGDIGAVVNSSLLTISDANKRLTFGANGANLFFDIDADNKVFQMGDITTAASGSVFRIEDVTGIFTFRTTASDTFASFDAGSGVYQLGDLMNVNNNSKLRIDDASASVSLAVLTTSLILESSSLKFSVGGGISATFKIDNLIGAKEYQLANMAPAFSTIPMSVNGSYADTNGNIILSADATKFTKGGDLDGVDLSIGTNDSKNFYIKTNSTVRMAFDTSGNVAVGHSTPLFRLHVKGSGVSGSNAIIALGDDFGGDPRICLSERGGTDTDQAYLFANNGVYIGTGIYNSAIKFAVKSTGTVVGGETSVASTELTVIGNQDISGNLNIQGSGTVASFFKHKTAATPSSPANGTEVNIYYKSNKIVFQYNDGGTVRYKYLDLTGTGVTWVHTTVAP